MKDQYGSRILRLYFIRAIYCTAGFVCKVLIMQIMQDIVGLQILILQLHLYLHFNPMIIERARCI